MHVIADFRIVHKAEMDEKLEAAIAAARADAFVDGTSGVLVTRHDYDHFTVALSPEVPFGLIHEHDRLSEN